MKRGVVEAVRRLALLFARPTWWGLVWLMRRGWMRRAQEWPAKFLHGERRATFLRRHYAQNRFARRIGLPLLILSYEVLLASALISVMYQGALKLIDGGYIMPESLRERMVQRDEE